METVLDASFGEYGKVLAGFDFTQLVKTLVDITAAPKDRVLYEASVPELEELPVFEEMKNSVYGGQDIQIGYCNGYNTTLNCMEYHRGCECCVAADDIVLMVAKMQDMDGLNLDTRKIKRYVVPAGTGVMTYETTLHYSPARLEEIFRTVIVLPRFTNTERPCLDGRHAEDALLYARNKWLLAHPDSPEAQKGGFVGLTGPNIDLRNDKG